MSASFVGKNCFVLNLYAQFARLQADVMAQTRITNPVGIEDVYPCSPMQQEVLLDQISDSSEAYHTRRVCEITDYELGQVDLDKGERAWAAVVKRHDILRIVFVESSSVAACETSPFFQAVLKKPKVNIRRLSIQGEDDGQVVSVFVEWEGDVLIYTTKQPQHRVTICTTATGKIYFNLDVNPAIVNAFTLNLLFRDLVREYGVLGDSGIDYEMTSVKQHTSSSYGDFVSLFLQPPSGLIGALEYWKTRHEGVQPCFLDAPLAGVDVKRRKTKVLRSVFEAEEVSRLQRSSDTHSAPLANMTQLAWAVVLSRFIGLTDVVFGYLTGGRDVPVPGIEQIAGPTVHMMVSRVKLDTSRGLVDSVKGVQEDTLEGMVCRGVMVGEVEHGLGLEYGELFGTTVSFNSRRQISSNGSVEKGLMLTEMEISAGYELRDSEFNLEVVGELLLEGSLGVFKKTDESLAVYPAFISTHNLHLQTQNGTRQVRQMYRTGDLVRQNIKDGSLTVVGRKDDPQNKIRGQRASSAQTVHSSVLKQCSARPDSFAVCAWDGNLTYAELEEQSHLLAKRLAARGAGLESAVVVMTEKSKWAVIAQLAVLRAGGVVVSVNPEHPLQRIQGLVRDTDAKIILTTCLTNGHHGQQLDNVLVMDQEESREQDGNDYSRVVMIPPVTSANAAFIIFTSGSTGKPKGVVLEHGAMVGSLKALASRFGVNEKSRVLQFSTYTSRLTLIMGGCVCISSEQDRLSNLAGTMKNMDVNFSLLTPTVAGLLDGPEQVETLETLVWGLYCCGC
ncbi:hypothetical protein QBC38DRAFT_487579 [Podospora fimiseda]|uniref:AMP-dependent synthetase/ligase domain-containing protein n=1 Tax=Podospora fimiseda TaxID=252190 RepID=A0AAN7GXJ7_9PEZI|nr:hypothetical protein QBC38DRAFT_487579 [Podospora fimiseda]